MSAGTGWKKRHVKECKILEGCSNKIEPLSIPNLTFLLWMFERGLSLPRVNLNLNICYLFKEAHLFSISNINLKCKYFLVIFKGDLLLPLLRVNLNLNICMGHLREHFYCHLQNINLNVCLRCLRGAGGMLAPAVLHQRL